MVSIDNYVNVESYDEDALLCAAYQQPVIVSINAGEYDFQLYAEVHRRIQEHTIISNLRANC